MGELNQEEAFDGGSDSKEISYGKELSTLKEFLFLFGSNRSPVNADLRLSVRLMKTCL